MPPIIKVKKPLSNPSTPPPSEVRNSSSVKPKKSTYGKNLYTQPGTITPSTAEAFLALQRITFFREQQIIAQQVTINTQQATIDSLKQALAEKQEQFNKAMDCASTFCTHVKNLTEEIDALRQNALSNTQVSNQDTDYLSHLSKLESSSSNLSDSYSDKKFLESLQNELKVLKDVYELDHAKHLFYKDITNKLLDRALKLIGIPTNDFEQFHTNYGLIQVVLNAIDEYLSNNNIK